MNCPSPRGRLATCLLCLLPWVLPAVDLPPEFEDVPVLQNLLDPASMAFAPDGRLFFGERISGKLRVASFDAASNRWTLASEPFFTFDLPPNRHRSSGLRGFAFDPDFANNGYIYVFYMKNNPRHNRVVRIQADPNDPDRALPDSETLLIELPFNSSSSSGSHNGGDLAFGSDGKLYITTGDGWNGGDDVQRLDTYTGKLFRINPNGTIPADNPFFNQTTGNYRAIYALGLRNPYTMATHPVTGKLYINEARGPNKADVYLAAAGANFGHDGFDGIGSQTSPWANVSGAGGKLVTGGAWYPESGYWPEAYRGSYFAALWGGNGSSTDGRIVRVDPGGATPSVSEFARDVYQSPGRHKPVMCKIGPDQDLYYLLTDYETGAAQIRKITYTGIPSAAAPVLDPPPGQYDEPQLVSLSTATSGASLYYTTDGSRPDDRNTPYTGPVAMEATGILRAVAYAPGLAPSPVSGGEYRIGPEPNQPPVADAGPDLLAQAGKEVTLNGAASYDPDGSPLEIVEEWVQLDGPAVTIEDADETVANFTPFQTGTYLFEITITDVDGATDKDQCTITVVEEIPDVLDGLLARWRMEAGEGNTVRDYSPNGNRGILEGPAWQAITPDNSRYALYFDGVDDRVDVGQLDLSTNALSISFWFQAESFTTHDARFISKAGGQNDEDHYWMVSTLDGSKLRFRLKAGGSTTTLTSPDGLLETGTWQHVVAVYNGAQMILYLNGEQVIATNKSGPISTDPDLSVALGNQPADATGGGRPFHGLLDEVRIYDRALSREEVQTVRDAAEVVVNTVRPPVAGAGIRAYPSPARDRVFLEGQLPDNVPFQLLDPQGRLLRTGRLGSASGGKTISLTGLPAGWYLIRLPGIGPAVRVLKAE